VDVIILAIFQMKTLPKITSEGDVNRN